MMDAFLADKSANAYQKMVDQLMAKSRSTAKKWPCIG
jgi:hypothetical protein